MVAVMEQRQTAQQTGQMVILRNVSWSLYEQLSAEQGDISNPRFAYDNGILEIKVASFGHEQINRIIARAFETMAEELGIDYINAGSTTFKRGDLEKLKKDEVTLDRLAPGASRGIAAPHPGASRGLVVQ